VLLTAYCSAVIIDEPNGQTLKIVFDDVDDAGMRMLAAA